jgi:hypothetical protein
MTITQQELLKQAKDNLSETYIDAVFELDISDRIETIADEYGLDTQQTDILDQETIYLLLGITNSPEFTERLGDIAEIENKTLLKVITAVTSKILKPLKESLESSGDSESSASIPVPPPPSPSAGYGGTSDPYREPADN